MTLQHAIPPSNIQAELTRIWEALESTNKIRACLFNFIIYTQKNQRDVYIHKIAQKVIEKFPSRVIFVSIDKSHPKDYLETAVSVLSASKGECDIACDFIEIEASASQQARVPFVILPHILPDLPVYLVWADDPVENNPLYSQLEKFASRIIFDSETTNHLPRFAQVLSQYLEASHCNIADLNWARIENWRDLLSTTFYSPERLSHLKRAKTVQISYNARETPFFCHTKIQSIYLQAWLASQLDWKWKELKIEPNGIQFIYDSLSISLVPLHHAHLSPGMILSVEILTDQEHHFVFSRNLEFPHQINMQISTKEKCEIPTRYIFAKAESGQSLVKEIFHKGTSLHYLNVLNLVKQWDKLDQC